MHLRSRTAVLSAATVVGIAIAGGTAFAATTGGHPKVVPAQTAAVSSESHTTTPDAPGGPDVQSGPNVQSGSQSTTGLDTEAAGGGGS